MASRDDPRPRRPGGAGGGARKAVGGARKGSSAGRPAGKGAGKAAGARKAGGMRKAAGRFERTDEDRPQRPGGVRKAGGDRKAAGVRKAGGARKAGGDRKPGGDRNAGGVRKGGAGRYGYSEDERASGGGARRTPPRRDRDRPADPEAEAGRARVERARKAGWGGVARSGARIVTPRKDGKTTASGAWRSAVDAASSRPVWEPERWVEDDEVRDEAERAVGRGGQKPSEGGPEGRTPRERRRQPGGAAMADAREELAKVVGDRQAAKYQQQLADAARAFERERYQDARRVLRTLAERAPGSAAVRELHGLTLYRMGQWKAAANELEAFRTLTGSSEQHPVLADTYRALGRYTDVEELWQELRSDSPSAELVAEGRIVAAGALADQGKLAAAIALLEQAKFEVKRPKPHHLRLWYAAADLHERAGDVPRARELFERIRRHEPDFADVAERLSSL